MISLYHLLLGLHIVLGATALLLFWLPVMTKKGSLDHKRFGRYYAYVMYGVALSGASLAMLVISWPLIIKQQLINDTTDLAELALRLRISWGFLLYLSLLTFTNIRHGNLVITHKNNHSNMCNWPHLSTIALLFIGGLALLLTGYFFSNVLHMIFGGLGVTLAYRYARFCLSLSVAKNRWLIEHLGAFIISGIAAYTAFFAFGGRSVFADIGQLQMVFWLAPGVIGAIFISRLSKKYQSLSHE